jgi:hypothetical protein
MSQNHFYKLNWQKGIALHLTPDESIALVAIINTVADDCFALKRRAAIDQLVVSDLNTVLNSRLRQAYFKDQKISLKIPPGQAVCLYRTLDTMTLSYVDSQSVKNKLHKALTDKDLI